MLVHRPPTRHVFSPRKLVFISGLSDPLSCALSPAQSRLLSSFAAPDLVILPTNFPYLPDSPPSRNPSLFTASFHNGVQFLQASSASYRSAAAAHWTALLASTDRLTVLALSCGLEILNQCVAHAPPSIPIDVIALGPVARSSPRFPCKIVRGSRDLVSMLFFPKPNLLLPGVGHLDYIDHPQVRQLLRATLCNNTLRSSEPACISPRID